MKSIKLLPKRFFPAFVILLALFAVVVTLVTTFQPSRAATYQVTME